MGNVPPLRFTVPVVNVKVDVFKTALVGLTSVPPLTVVGAVSVPLNVVVPLEQVNDTNVFALGVIVPVPIVLTVKLVYVPPAANTKLYTCTVPAAGVQVLPVKSNVVKHDSKKVGMLAPAFINKFGGEGEVLIVASTENCLVIDMFALNPPAPVALNPAEFPIFKFTAPTVILVRFIKFDPKLIERIVLLLPWDTKLLQVQSKPFKFILPSMILSVELKEAVFCTNASTNLTVTFPCT